MKQLPRLGRLVAGMQVTASTQFTSESQEPVQHRNQQRGNLVPGGRQSAQPSPFCAFPAGDVGQRAAGCFGADGGGRYERIRMRRYRKKGGVLWKAFCRAAVRAFRQVVSVAGGGYGVYVDTQAPMPCRMLASGGRLSLGHARWGINHRFEQGNAGKEGQGANLVCATQGVCASSSWLSSVGKVAATSRPCTASRSLVNNMN